MPAADPIRVILNPAAGHGAGWRRLKDLEEASRKLGIEIILDITRRPGHASELASRAARQGVKVVGVMGGDGTVGEVINGLVSSKTILGIIGIGTGNDVARSLGLPLNNPRRSLEVLLEGRVKNIDLGEAGGRYFVSVLGIGFPAEVAAEANRISRFKGSIVFFLAMYKSLLRMKPVWLELKYDGNEIEGYFTSLVVQNTPFTGGGLLIAPEAKLDDGLFDVVTVGEIRKIDLMINLPKLYRGNHLKHPRFSLVRCKSLEVRSQEKLPTMFDGDAFGSTPLEIKMRKQALRVIVEQ